MFCYLAFAGAFDAFRLMWVLCINFFVYCTALCMLIIQSDGIWNILLGYLHGKYYETLSSPLEFLLIIC